MKKMLFVLLAIVAISLFTTPVFAQEAGATVAAKSVNWVAITAGFALAFAVAFAALGQGKVASSACEGLARNPAARAGIQLAMILGLAFIESLVLFTFVMIFLKVK